MDTHRAQFDSHRFVKRLTKAGLPEEVAEVLADEHTNLIVPADVATKGDVAAVRTEMATKDQFETVQGRLDTVEGRLETVEGKLATVQGDLATVRSEMATKEELHREIAACEHRLLNAMLQTKISLIKWMITTMMVFSGIVIGAMTALQ